MYSWGHTLADLNEPFNVARLLKSAQHRLDLLLFLAVTFQLLASPGQAFEQKIGHANYFFLFITLNIDQIDRRINFQRLSADSACPF